jgi:hypothetical protein
MASPGFTKRQREQARKEKQRDKAARKLARKREKEELVASGLGGVDENGMPIIGDEGALGASDESDEQDAGVPAGNIEGAAEDKQ